MGVNKSQLKLKKPSALFSGYTFSRFSHVLVHVAHGGTIPMRMCSSELLRQGSLSLTAELRLAPAMEQITRLLFDLLINVNY